MFSLKGTLSWHFWEKDFFISQYLFCFWRRLFFHFEFFKKFTKILHTFSTVNNNSDQLVPLLLTSEKKRLPLSLIPQTREYSRLEMATFRGDGIFGPAWCGRECMSIAHPLSVSLLHIHSRNIAFLDMNRVENFIRRESAVATILWEL
jgi:hypothetical protein